MASVRGSAAREVDRDPYAPFVGRCMDSSTPAVRRLQHRASGDASGHLVCACCSRISCGVGPSRYPQGAHWEYVTPWSHCRAPHWGQGCHVAWSTGNRCGVGAGGTSGGRENKLLLSEHQGSRCPSPACDAVWHTSRAARLTCARPRHSHGNPRGTLEPQTNDGLVPIPKYGG